MSALVHSHSGLRWVLLILLILTVIKAFGANRAGNAFPEADKKFSLFTMIVTHLQAVLGLGLYFMSQKVDFSSTMMSSPVHRFFTMEHTVMMLIAIILITLGHRHAKAGNARKVFWHFLIALIVILAAIPWPFRTALSGSWF